MMYTNVACTAQKMVTIIIIDVVITYLTIRMSAFVQLVKGIHLERALYLEERGTYTCILVHSYCDLKYMLYDSRRK